jgi:hypothetical protein
LLNRPDFKDQGGRGVRQSPPIFVCCAGAGLKSADPARDRIYHSFFIGGIAVSAFAVLGDLVRPKSFAGLFGAAPSIALATLAMTFLNQGADYAALEGRSMMIGAFALCLYSMSACRLTKRWQLSSSRATMVSLIVWLVVALGGKWMLLG